MPPAIGDDGNRRFADFDDVANARRRARLGFVVTLDLGAEYGGIRDGCVQHPRKFDIDGKNLLACDLVRGVEPRERLAGDLPLLRVFELDLFGRFELCGRAGDLAIGCFAACRRVGDDARLGLAHGGRHLPLVGCGLDEHFARFHLRHGKNLIKRVNRSTGNPCCFQRR